MDAEHRAAEGRREAVHLITQPTRFEIVEAVNSGEEHDGRTPHAHIQDAVDASLATVTEHLSILVGAGILDRYEIPAGERSRDEPYVFYWLTERGREHYEYVVGRV